MLAIKNKFFFLLLLLFLFLFGSLTYSDNYKSHELDRYFEKLALVNKPDSATLIEKKIWKIWNKHPQNEKLTNKLEFGKELMNEGSYNYALLVFTNIIKTDPLWSEAWNSRATLLFYMNNYKESLRDIDKTLKLEPRHFGALSGRAQILISLGQYQKAIIDLRKIAKIHPSIKDNRLINELEKLVKGLNI
jgi:tetratricopeptide (TPR) repeat protein